MDQALKALEKFRNRVVAKITRNAAGSKRFRVILAEVDSLIHRVKFQPGSSALDSLEQRLSELRAALESRHRSDEPARQIKGPAVNIFRNQPDVAAELAEVWRATQSETSAPRKH